MDSLFRDVSRLHLIEQMNIGQERFSVATHFADFTRYYFQRFMVNVTSVFKNHLTSEVKDLNARHQSKIDTIVKYPALRSSKQIVPIPKGMVYSYRQTLDTLLEILGTVHAETVEKDLEAVLASMGTGGLKTLQIDHLDKQTFEDLRARIGKLFGKTGLSHSTVSFVLPSPKDLGYVNTKLLDVTSHYYPSVMKLNPLLKKVETKFDQLKFSEQDKVAITALLMVMAYRLSIFAVVMDHLQSLEHGFVGSVDLILKYDG